MRIGLALGAGVLWGLCCLYTSLAPFLPLAFLLALQGLRQVETARQAAWFGLLFGCVRYAVGSNFLLALGDIDLLGYAFYPLAISYYLPFAVLESWGALRLERLLGIPRVAAFGILYTALEPVRSLGDLSFPTDLLAQAFGVWPQWLALSPWAGPYGLTFIVLLCAVLLDQAWSQRRTPRGLLALAAAIMTWSLPVIVDQVTVSPPSQDARTFHVAVLQPVTGVQEKMDRASRPATWKTLEKMTLQASEALEKPNLIVWPESSRPDPITWKGQGPFRDDRMHRLARQAGAPILYGTVIARVVDGRLKALYNGAALAFPDDRPAQWYGKQQLLPVAEKVPFRQLFGLDPYASNQSMERKSILPMLGRFLEGPEPTLFLVDGLSFGVLICYEGMYPELSRAYRKKGANAVVILTNDAWWGDSEFVQWHAQKVSFISRSLEIPVIRAANNGISSLTDHRGRRLVATDLNERTTVHIQVTPGSSVPTFYARTGNIGLFGLLAVCCAVFPVMNRIRGNRQSSSRSAR
ncbi:MAG: apolipoprotein N-acyltransferase [Acidobacteria bacterium]|uniref:Apolipoprotein N-acyltransferase n=1 Tax=Candidatus Polarisedimenticola svalbardensis TaxID=2886004 RepID=A0A8J6Y6F7_9BACT|nr:apolipoprotein N-acyltransferase [Candidatus Polarisedimenticola svalbardensis]